MAKKIDARIIKTKAKLVETFMDLISKRDFESITVNDICDNAGIRRATFYKHYNDKYDFFKYIVSTLRQEFDEEWMQSGKGGKLEYFSEYAMSLVDFFDQHTDIINNICKSNASTAMFNIAASENYSDTRKHLENQVEAGQSYHASLSTISTMLVGGTLHTLVDWVKGGKQMSPSQLKVELKMIIDTINKYN